MNEQEVFNEAYKYHVIDQKPLGYTRDNEGETHCSYAQGCAIGCQLTAEELEFIAQNSWEGTSANAVVEEGFLKSGGALFERYKKVPKAFLVDLQVAHDTAVSGQLTSFVRGTLTAQPEEAIKINYEALASRYGLEVPNAH
jgi:hypothetical protein